MVGAEEFGSLEYTPTWIVAAVCFIIVLISILAERGLHRLGKGLKRRRQNALFEALQKLKDELMLLGFISLLLTVGQGLIRDICIPAHMSSYMLPCKLEGVSEANHNQNSYQINKNGRRLLAKGTGSADHCAPKGKVPLLSLEALHQLHMFIFVLAVVHVIFCASTMVLGGAKIRRWKIWEDSIRKELSNLGTAPVAHHHQIFKQRAGGYWRKAAVISWIIAFFKQFYGSVSKSDYIALRSGFIRKHCPGMPNFDFHKYMLRTLEVDFKKIVSISWYLWLFVVLFLLLNIKGWHAYFWLSFLPLALLLLVGAKLEHIITRLAKEAQERPAEGPDATPVKPSDEFFWFHKPAIVLYLIHFILFQNSFEIGFFFWIWSTYGFDSCIMERLHYIIPRLVMGVIVQVLCSYSTLPLYVIVTQMGSRFKQGMFNEFTQGAILAWARGTRDGSSNPNRSQMSRMDKVSFESIYLAEQTEIAAEENMQSAIELSETNRTQFSSS